MVAFDELDYILIIHLLRRLKCSEDGHLSNSVMVIKITDSFFILTILLKVSSVLNRVEYAYISV